MADMLNEYKILMGIPEVKKPLERNRCRL